VINSEIPLDRLVAALKAGPPLRFALLFGSVAAGTHRDDSDVDIAIFPDDPSLSLGDELSLQTELARICQRPVDLVRIDRAPTIVRWQTVRHGKPLFEAVPFAIARFAADSVADYLDFAPAFERSTEAFRRALLRETGRSAP
jgi:predicted nucleotidyltransferase